MHGCRRPFFGPQKAWCADLEIALKLQVCHIMGLWYINDSDGIRQSIMKPWEGME